jgi:hypothetical protein
LARIGFTEANETLEVRPLNFRTGEQVPPEDLKLNPKREGSAAHRRR